MGAILSKWRKKPSTIEILESLDKEIHSLEKVKQTNLETQRKIIGSLLLYSVLLYVVAALVFYFYYMPEAVRDRILYSSPLLLFPFLVWGIKRFLHWYFVKRITKNELALENLREKKKTILEEVMEKETYKKAKEILEKFDPERHRKLENTETTTPAPQKAPDGQDLRRRGGTPPRFSGTPSPQVFMTPAGRGVTPMIQKNGQRLPLGTPSMPPPPGPPLPRPIIPRERSTSEKLIEFMIGDGPQNRYALVCKQCLSHNGMALKEEFEYLAFRCCYCYFLNPARKQRPNAPKLPTFTPPTPRKIPLPETESSEEGSEGHSTPEEKERKVKDIGASNVQGNREQIQEKSNQEKKGD